MRKENQRVVFVSLGLGAKRDQWAGGAVAEFARIPRTLQYRDGTPGFPSVDALPTIKL
jgi:hypothetical protein